MRNQEHEMEIDLLQLVRALWKNVKYIAAAAVAFGLAGLLISSFFMTPIYQASAKMIVNTRKDQNQTVTNDQINSAKNLVDTYAIIIESRDVLNRVITELDLKESHGQLAGCITVQAVNNTQIMEVIVRHKDWKTAQAIAEKILQVAPEMIVDTVEAGSVNPVEQAHVSQNPVSPNVMKNTVLMAIVGFVLSCGIVIVIFLSDNTYKSELEIKKDLNLPVLGVIPTIESCSNHSQYGYGNFAKTAGGRK